MTAPPYETIQEQGDRSWSLRLLDRLKKPDLQDNEREIIVSTLWQLDDPRCVQPLIMLLTDSAQSTELRTSASEILSWSGIEPDRATLLAWWNSGDQILRRHALGYMGPSEAAIVEKIAADRAHPLYRDAIDTLSFKFEKPEHQQLKIQALSHPDPEIRETAANTLLWDEPLVAEEPLLAATNDPNPTVAEAACEVLYYYPTQKVLLHLNSLRASHRDEHVRTQAALTYDGLRDTFTRMLDLADSGRHIRRWLEPVWELLAYTPDVLEDEPPTTSPEREKQKISVEDVRRVIDNPDASPFAIRDFFFDSDWTSISPEERESLTLRFVQHADRLVRREAVKALSAWGDQRSLIALLSDEDIIVRKSAMYYLGTTSPSSEEIANLAWEHFNRVDVWGTIASEALTTYVVHANPQQATRRLTSLVEDVQAPESLRVSAVYNLEKLEARPNLGNLMRFVEHDPVVTWSLHDALLGAARDLELPPPDLSRFLEVDHLTIQEAIAPFV